MARFHEVDEDMQENKCSHVWEMVNVAGGLIVMKKCFHCGKVDYFDQQSKSLRHKIRIVPHEMVRSIDSCYAEVIKDPDVLFTTAPEGK